MIDLRHLRAPVPRRFVGLSFEASSLPLIGRYATEGTFVRRLRSLGPGVMRFGGISVDYTNWTEGRRSGPLWPASTISRDDLSNVARVARETGWRVLLGVALGHYDPQAAASEVAAAQADFGKRLMAVELGNEPEAYAPDGLRSEPWGFPQYQPQVDAYRGAIAAVAPGVRLAGPDSAAFESWLRPAAVAERPALVTGHHYLLGCNDASPPTIGRLLSAQMRRREGRSLAHYMSISRAAGIPVRLDETNSVSCGGQAGVSDTFASALWAVDYLVRAMAAGIAGVDLHGHLENCRGYSPLCASSPRDLNSGALRAQPEWYALLLARALVGDRPARTLVSPRSPNIDVTALLSPDGRVHVVIVDDRPPGARPVTIRIGAGPRFTTARLERLTAPSLSARSGVKLAGRAVGRDGSWRGRALTRLSARRGAFQLRVPPSSALLVTLSSR